MIDIIIWQRKNAEMLHSLISLFSFPAGLTQRMRKSHFGLKEWKFIWPCQQSCTVKTMHKSMMDTASAWMGNCKWHTSSFRIIIIWSRDVWKTREGWRSWGSTHFQFSTSVDLTISYCWHSCTVTMLFTQHSPLFYYR